jgi:hypothetical protein
VSSICKIQPSDAEIEALAAEIGCVSYKERFLLTSGLEAQLSLIRASAMPNKLVPNGKILVTARADWALGYDTAGDEGTLLIAMEAKQRSEFSKGEAQLIAYLAILRENRLKARKPNIITQGFFL